MTSNFREESPMKLGKCVIFLAAMGLTAPVLAASTAAGSNSSPTSINETNAANPTQPGVKPEGSGTGNGGTQAHTTKKSRSGKDMGATNGGTGIGATGSSNTGHAGASSVNETNGSSSQPGVKPEGSGSGGGTQRGSAGTTK
jgi:hypothetical protein